MKVRSEETRRIIIEGTADEYDALGDAIYQQVDFDSDAVGGRCANALHTVLAGEGHLDDSEDYA